MSCEVSRGKVQLSLCVCVCVCVCERERKRERETVVEGYVGEADRGPCVPSTPGLCGPRTVCAHHDTLDGWLHKPDTLPGASLFLILPSPLLFLEEVRQIVLPVELAFSFSVGYL